MSLKNVVEEELLRAGATPYYAGYYYLLYAVETAIAKGLAFEDAITWVYAEVARAFGVSRSAVERNIRVLSMAIWEKGDTRNMDEAPRNSELIGMIAGRVMLRLHAAQRTAMPQSSRKTAVAVDA